VPKFVLREIFQVVHLTLVVPLDLSCPSLLSSVAMLQHILPVLFLTIVLAAGTGAETLPVIQWQDQRMSITAKNVLLADILRTVAQQTGINGATPIGLFYGAPPANCTIATEYWHVGNLTKTGNSYAWRL
jgi:hypothetical protein